MINKALQKCLKNGVKVYPIFKDYKWYVQVDIKGRKKTIEKPVQQKDINESVSKTYIFYSEKL